MIVVRQQPGNTKRFKWQDRSTKLALYKNPRNHAHGRPTRRFRQFQRPEPSLFRTRDKSLPDIRIKITPRWGSRRQKQLLLLEIGAFPRQQLSLNKLRRGILDKLLLFGQPEIHRFSCARRAVWNILHD